LEEARLGHSKPQTASYNLVSTNRRDGKAAEERRNRFLEKQREIDQQELAEKMA
jgi:hypothetical protein